jgi:DNA-binding SARP family transcriptional activator
LYERERLRTIYLIMLGKLMAYCEEYQEYESGLTYGHHILCCEPAHERTHRKMMRLYYLSGDRTAALRQYQRCVTTLRRELDVAPTHSTTKLYDQIKLDRLNTSVLDTIESDPDSTDTRTLPGFGGLSVH